MNKRNHFVDKSKKRFHLDPNFLNNHLQPFTENRNDNQICIFKPIESFSKNRYLVQTFAEMFAKPIAVEIFFSQKP